MDRAPKPGEIAKKFLGPPAGLANHDPSPLLLTLPALGTAAVFVNASSLSQFRRMRLDLAHRFGNLVHVRSCA
jgi:hypothetical protein